MRFGKILTIVLIVTVLGLGIYKLVVERLALQKEVKEMSESYKALRDENKSLTADILYFKEPENLLKELKSQFNYRESGEGLIIIVPDSPR